jgi:undecaprenyl pyrophosphate phosphatase UppP
MATPITLATSSRRAADTGIGVPVEVVPLIVGLIASLGSGFLAIHVMLRDLRTRSLDIFVWYRLVLAAIVIVVWLAG